MSKKSEPFVKLVMVFFVMALLFTSSVALCEDDTQQVMSSAQERLKTKITFSCREMPITTVLMQLAELANIDILPSPKVIGNVTVKITDVPLDEALTNILAAHGFTYVATENMLRVVPQAEISILSEKMVTQIYRITYADIESVEKALQSFISEKGSIATSKATSNIMVTETESKINAIDNYIKEIDRETPQLLIEARIYDVTSNERFELDPRWLAMRSTPITTINKTNQRTDSTFKGTGLTETSVDDGIIVEALADSDTYTEFEDTTEITSTDTPLLRGKPIIGGSFDPVNGGFLEFGLFNDAVTFAMAIQILQTELEANLLANPRVLVLDNQTANFKIIREVPYTESIEAIGDSAAVIARIEFKEIGVILDVTPHITRDDMIRLKIAPEFGVQVGTNEVGAPEIDTRKLSTIVLIKDGQTVSLGGLRKKETSATATKVPLLGDIPLLGGFFRGEVEREITTELVVFITTTIVKDLSLTKREQINLERTNFRLPAMVNTDKLDSIHEPEELAEGAISN